MTLIEADLDRALDEIGARWIANRPERQTRRHLDPADFQALCDAGLLAAAAPRSAGGLWDDMASSTRAACERYRRLAMADPSVALVSSMHPAVLSYWLATPDELGDHAWAEQRAAAFSSAVDGAQWGTITSEPGSGGDIAKTRSVASPTDASPFLPGTSYAITGDKHFGSGSGVTAFMMTTARPTGEDDPTIFVLDVRDRPWDGTAGLRLVAEWDGMGMAATQSHAMRLEDAPGVRLAFPGPLETITLAATPFVMTLFTAVVLGIVDAAVALANEQLRAKADQLRPYEQVEWVQARQDHWLAQQAYDGALRAIESGGPRPAIESALRAKQATAQLAEQTLSRLTRVLGGGTFSGRSPFAHWFEDVRALGFLRPPWALAADSLFGLGLDGTASP